MVAYPLEGPISELDTTDFDLNDTSICEGIFDASGHDRNHLTFWL